MYLCNSITLKTIYMKRLLSILMALLFVSTTAFAQLKANDYAWLGSIRAEHPRMFFTSEDVPQIVSNSMLFDARMFNGTQKRIDKLMEKGDESKNEKKRNNSMAQYGYRAADAAMLWVVTKNQKYLDFTKTLLNKAIAYCDERLSVNENPNGQAFPIITALCAYDWIYNDLTAEERADLGKRLYKVCYDIAWHGDGIRPKRPRENISSSHTSTMHGNATLPWYIGLTFYGEGINDEECEKMLHNGYDLHQKMTVHRAKMLGKNGGSHNGTIGNGFDPYPYAEYNFIYTFRSATGIDPMPQMKYMMGYLKYLDWICLPNNKEFGIGDSAHSDNKLPRNMVVHVKELSNLLVKNDPEKFNWFASLVARYNEQNTRPSTMHFLPFLHRYHFDADDEITVVDAKNKQSHCFNNLGQIVMRSGVGEKDTYAVFLAGRKDKNRQHYDINHFVIYKNGYRALDSGTRPSPGQHQSHYYCRTVAHNCITILMPGEEMPRHWTKAAPHEDADVATPNDGGQRYNRGGKLLAHKETEDYVYIASDASSCYHAAKAEKVVREFVWIKPDIFVVYDRVESDKAEYAKRWLYHTASEPIMNGKSEFSEVSQGGKSICRTLLPKGAVIERIGGEGKQFWSDGKNWPIPEYKADDPALKRYKGLPRNNHPLVGQWRVEVSPKKAATNDHFLHIIQVGNESLQALPQTECKDSKDAVTLKFNYEGKTYTLTFDKTKKSGCTIEVK